MGQGRVFYDIECPLLPVLVEMEHEGVRMESEVLDAMARQFQEHIEETAARIYELAGEEFNLNSGQQLWGGILFEKLALADPQCAAHG